MSRPPPTTREADWSAMLRARPCRNRAVRTVENDRSGITVYVKRRKPAWFVPPVSWIVPYTPEQEIVLDALGSRIWSACDGRQTVEEIVDRFRTEERLSFHEARAAVVGYLQALVRRGVVAIVMQGSP